MVFTGSFQTMTCQGWSTSVSCPVSGVRTGLGRIVTEPIVRPSGFVETGEGPENRGPARLGSLCHLGISIGDLRHRERGANTGKSGDRVGEVLHTIRPHALAELVELPGYLLAQLILRPEVEGSGVEAFRADRQGAGNGRIAEVDAHDHQIETGAPGGIQ